MDDDENNPVAPPSTQVSNAELKGFRDELKAEKREEHSRRQTKQFLMIGHDGIEKDIVEDFHGKSFCKWALRVDLDRPGADRWRFGRVGSNRSFVLMSYQERFF